MPSTKPQRKAAKAVTLGGEFHAEASHRFVQHARVTAAVKVRDGTDELRLSVARTGLNANAIENQLAEITLRRSELSGLAALFTELASKVCEHDMSVLGGKGNGSRAATFLERNPGWLGRAVRQTA